LPAVRGERSEGTTTYDDGPIAYPCTILAHVSLKLEVSLRNLVQCEWSLKKDSIQL